MTEIKRFDEGGYGTSDMSLSDHGDWVDYDDHATIVAALQAESDSNLKSAQYSAETNRKIVKKNIELHESIAALQEQVRALAAEMTAVESIHAAAVFITDDDFDKCPQNVQKIIKSLAVMLIPATGAFIREIRAQARAEGIHFAANRLLAAWETGFVDDTPASVHDISGAILSAVEFLPNAFEAEFKRDYADEVRARIRAGEQP